MIKASTVLDHEHMLALHKYSRSLSSYKSARNFLVTALIGLIAFAVWVLSKGFQMLFIACVFILIYGVFRMSILLIRLMRKPKKPKEDARYEYTFDDEYFGFVCTRHAGTFERHRRYASVHSAVEWQGYLFVQITYNEYCIIRFDELTEGSPDELRAFLREKLGTRFTAK